MDNELTGSDVFRVLTGKGPATIDYVAWVVMGKMPALESMPRHVTGILEFVTTINIPRTARFNISLFLRRHAASIRIHYLGDNLTEKFLSIIESPSNAVMAKVHHVRRSALHNEIMKELDNNYRLSLARFFSLLLAQGRGGPGPLLVNGGENYAYVSDDAGKCWKIVAHYYQLGGWCIETNWVERTATTNSGAYWYYLYANNEEGTRLFSP